MMTSKDKRKAKAILAEIVRQYPGTFRGKTRLYKAFLFAHLFYFRDNPGFLSEWPIVHMPQGHGIDQGEGLLSELVASGIMARRTEACGPYPEAVFSVEQTDPDPDLDDADKEAVSNALSFIAEKTGTELSDVIHENSRAYKEGRSGDALNIYIDAFPDEWIEEHSARFQQLSREVDRVFRA